MKRIQLIYIIIAAFLVIPITTNAQIRKTCPKCGERLFSGHKCKTVSVRKREKTCDVCKMLISRCKYKGVHPDEKDEELIAHNVKLICKPINSRLTIDAQDKGNIGNGERKELLEKGQHQIKVTNNGYKDEVIDINIDKDTTINVILNYSDRGEDLNREGDNLYKAKKYKEALVWYELAANKKHKEAQYSLGWQYEQGQGVSKDTIKAMEYYRMAAEQGHTDAQRRLGIYLTENGSLDDTGEAIRWLRKAVEKTTVENYKKNRNKKAVKYLVELSREKYKREKEQYTKTYQKDIINAMNLAMNAADYENAKDYSGYAMEFAPENFTYWYNHALALTFTEEGYKEAKKIFKKHKNTHSSKMIPELKKFKESIGKTFKIGEDNMQYYGRLKEIIEMLEK